MANDLSKEKSGELRCGDCGSGRDKMDHFGISVDDYENGIETTSSSRKKDDEIHADLLPPSRWNRDGLQQSKGTLSAGFVLLA